MTFIVTPIRIRGKRKARSSTHTNIPKALQKQQEEHPRLGKRAKKSLTAVMAVRSLQNRPKLESLPAEILEKILLYSENLSLPHASLVIGVRLSERATLIRFFISAFRDTWDQGFGIPVNKDLLTRSILSKRKKGVCQGDSALQSDVLKQPWAKINLILIAQQTWADKYAKTRSYQHSLPWVDEEIGISHSHDGGLSHFNSRNCFEVDYQQALKWHPFEEYADLTWGFQDIHPQTRIPKSLITGPWSEEQLQRLFWLKRAGMTPVPAGNDGPVWEDKIQFLRNAILEVTQPNLLALHCLLGPWCWKDLPPDLMRKEIRNIDERLKWGDDTFSTRALLSAFRNAMG